MHLMIYFELNDPEIGKHYNCIQKRLKPCMVSSFYPNNMCAKSCEGYNKNWMHFVYKLDHLFQSTSVSNENSSVTKAFNFSKLISILDFLCLQCEPFKATY